MDSRSPLLAGLWQGLSLPSSPPRATAAVPLAMRNQYYLGDIRLDVAFRVVFVLTIMLLAGCVDSDPIPETTEAELGSVEPVEPLDLRYEDCRWLRAFLDFDREATIDALPEGYTPHTRWTQLTYAGLLDIYQCDGTAEGALPLTIALAGVGVSVEEHPHEDANEYLFDFLVDDPSLAKALAERGVNATVAEMKVAQDPGGFTFTATADGLQWTDTHVRASVVEMLDPFQFTSAARWHIDADVHSWIDINERNIRGTPGLPWTLGKAIVQMEGGTTAPLVTMGEDTALYSLDSLLDVRIRTGQAAPPGDDEIQ